MTALNSPRDTTFDRHAIRTMGVAFDAACAILGPRGRLEAIQKVLAIRIIEVAKTGERAPHRLCERALRAAAEPEPLRTPVDVTPLQALYFFLSKEQTHKNAPPLS